MQSKTSFFNRTLFLNLFKRYWPIFVAYIIVWAAIMPMALGSNLNNQSPDNPMLMAANYVMTAGYLGGSIMSAIFGMIIAMAAFAYLYNSRSVSMMCSLPIKREGVFISVFTAGLVGMFVSNILIFAMTLAVEAAYGAVGIGYLLQWLAMVCLTNVFFFGFAALCASFTGHILVMPVVYIVLNFTVFVVSFLCREVLAMFIYGMRPGAMLETAASFSPVVGINANTHVQGVMAMGADGIEVPVSYFYSSWPTLLIYAAVGVAFAICALLLIKHRRMESASDVIAVNPLKPVFKYCMAFGCAVVLGMGFYGLMGISGANGAGFSQMLALLGCMLIGAFIGYFASEMLLKKTLRVFNVRAWVGMAAVAIIVSGLMCCGEFDVFGYERKLPSADEIVSVHINAGSQNVNLEDPENIAAAIALHSSIISHKAENEAPTSTAEQESADYRSFNVWISYTKKDETLFRRYYGDIKYPVTDDIIVLEKLLNSEEAVKARTEVSIPASIETVSDSYIDWFNPESKEYENIQLSAEEAMDLYTNCILPDAADGNMGKVFLIMNDEYDNNTTDCSITIQFSKLQKNSPENEYSYEEVCEQVNINAKRTIKWLEAKGVSPISLLASNEIRGYQDNLASTNSSSTKIE
ncbi:MAG: ABC transporter permease [Oscillospiraceae bacterium]